MLATPFPFYRFIGITPSTWKIAYLLQNWPLRSLVLYLLQNWPLRSLVLYLLQNWPLRSLVLFYLVIRVPMFLAFQTSVSIYLVCYDKVLFSSCIYFQSSPRWNLFGVVRLSLALWSRGMWDRTWALTPRGAFLTGVRFPAGLDSHPSSVMPNPQPQGFTIGQMSKDTPKTSN